jgi:hypothetical protein
MKDLGLTNNILGMQTYRNKSKNKIWLSQKELFEKNLATLQHARLIDTSTTIHFLYRLRDVGETISSLYRKINTYRKLGGTD